MIRTVALQRSSRGYTDRLDEGRRIAALTPDPGTGSSKLDTRVCPRLAPEVYGGKGGGETMAVEREKGAEACGERGGGS